MSWVRFVPGFSHHPKRLKAGPISSWFWVCSVDFCMEHLTDGFIDDAAVPTLCPIVVGNARKRAIENLVAVGSWERVEGGYLVHDYLRHNLSKAQVEADQEAARQRHRRWQQGRGSSQPNAVDNAVAEAHTTPLETPPQRRDQRRSNTARSQAVRLSGVTTPTSKPGPMSLDQSNNGHDPSDCRTALEVAQAVEAGHITQAQGSARLRELGKAGR